jgi:protein-disulfide isomerase
VTIVEFFDYNCPFCKKTEPELKKLLRSDAKVRIVYKEWPVFGEVSEYAARAALAANWQGKYLVAHDALIGVPNGIDEISQVDSVLKAAGIDLKQLDRDRKLHAKEIGSLLSRSIEEAQRLGLRGTPGFVIGRQVVPRSLDLPILKQLVGERIRTLANRLTRCHSSIFYFRSSDSQFDYLRLHGKACGDCRGFRINAAYSMAPSCPLE